MLVRYSCKDMGLNCPFVLKGEDEEEVIQKALDHVMKEHTEDFRAIHSQDEMKSMALSLKRSMRVTSG
jgi:predicted small metal-binding protein